MGLSTKHKELLAKMYPDGYELERFDTEGNVVDESGNFHILFVKIFEQPGQYENKLDASVQKISPKDWAVTLKLVEQFDLKAITQFDEFGIIHDPTVKVKPEAKLKPGRPPQNK